MDNPFFDLKQRNTREEDARNRELVNQIWGEAAGEPFYPRPFLPAHPPVVILPPQINIPRTQFDNAPPHEMFIPPPQRFIPQGQIADSKVNDLVRAVGRLEETEDEVRTGTMITGLGALGLCAEFPTIGLPLF